MAKAVLIEPDGSTIRGSYDGYGNLHTRSGREVELGDSAPCIYHQACYDLVGKPSFNGPSPGARDQGHFVGEYDPKKPHSRADVDALAQTAKDRAVADRAARLASLKEMRAECIAKGEPIPDWLDPRIAGFGG